MPVILRLKENQYRAFMNWDAGHDKIIEGDRISLPTPGLSATLTKFVLLLLFGSAKPKLVALHGFPGAHCVPPCRLYE